MKDQPTQDVEDKNPVGRPLKYKTVEEPERAINAYFDMCDPHTQRRVVDCGINEKGETIWRHREGHDRAAALYRLRPCESPWC